MNIMLIKAIFFAPLIFFATSVYCQENGKIIHTRPEKGTTSSKALEYYNNALTQFDQKDFKKSIELYKLAIAEDNNFIDAYDNLGLTFRQLNMLDSAEHYYLASFEKDSTNVTPIQNLAVIAELKNNLEKAKLLYLLITGMAPEDPEGYFGLARMQFGLGHLTEALTNGQLAEKYYKRINSPYISDCYYMLSIICYNMKDIIQAKKYLKLTKEAGGTVDLKLEEALK